MSPRAGATALVDECERVLADHGALERCVSIEPRRDEEQDADLRLLFGDRAWLQSPAGGELIAALREHPAVASAQRRRSALALRFEDAALAALERELAAGGRVGVGVGAPVGVGAAGAGLLAGQRFTVGLVGPNTNKALHVGHLRNIFLGAALASALECAGATVQRHSLVGDIGRRVCEAIGGYLTHHDGETPTTVGLAGDRFVELCSRDYQRGRAGTAASGDAADPNAEEREPRGDLADAIMEAWWGGAAAERQVWRRMREWVLTGHERTLARLGVAIDRYDYESQELQRALALIAEGLERGLFEREAAGGVVYRTGRSEYTTMVLLRGDGFPTEYARLMGVYDRILEDLDRGARYVELAGIEWQPSITVVRELLAALRPGPRNEAYEWVFHGLVTAGGQKVGSSSGAVTWIDDFLDELAAGPGASALEELAGGAVGRAEIADVLVRGTFLCAPTARPLAFVCEDLVQGRPGPGWTIAEAWCRAQHPGPPGSAAPLGSTAPGNATPVGSPAPGSTALVASPALVARTAVVQSQLFGRALRRAVQRLDTTSLSTHLLGLCEACLAAPAPGPAAPAMLAGALRSLGFAVQRREPHAHARELQEPRAAGGALVRER